MQITIELKTLQQKLESSLKIDAVQLKAVLFDLVMDLQANQITTVTNTSSVSSWDHTPVGSVGKIEFQYPEEPEPVDIPAPWTPTAPLEAEDAFGVEDDYVEEAKPLRPAPTPISTKKPRLSEKEAKRAELEKITSLSGKELLEGLIGKELKRNAHGQYVDVGVEEESEEIII